MTRTLGVCLVTAIFVGGCASAEPAEINEPEPVAADVEPEAEDVEAEPEMASVTIWDGVYTSAQADRGEETAETTCFACHSEGEWTNPMFLRVWSGRPIHQWWEQIRATMPYDSPGRLSAQEYADVVAYMLELNEVPAGDTELPSDAEGLQSITVTVPE